MTEGVLVYANAMPINEWNANEARADEAQTAFCGRLWSRSASKKVWVITGTYYLF